MLYLNLNEDCIHNWAQGSQFYEGEGKSVIYYFCSRNPYKSHSPTYSHITEPPQPVDVLSTQNQSLKHEKIIYKRFEMLYTMEYEIWEGKI